MDRSFERYLKNWGARQRPPASARQRLLDAAASASSTEAVLRVPVRQRSSNAEEFNEEMRVLWLRSVINTVHLHQALVMCT